MEKVIMIFAAALVMTAFAACSSDEPQDGEKEDIPTRVDTTAVIEDTVPKNDTVVPTDTFVPYDGPIEPLSDVVRPTLTEGKRWLMNFVTASEVYDICYTVMGDTVINGVQSVKIAQSPGLPSYYREENGYVSKYELINPGEAKPIYGFRLKYAPALNAPFTSDEFITLESYGTIVLMGKTLRAVKVSFGDSVDYWVEGIGPLFGLVANNDYPRTTFSPMAVKLLECWDGDRKIYDYREFSEDFYHPIAEF